MANVQLGSKAVGSTVKLKVNGTAKEFIVVHQGKPSSLYDESCNGTWLLMKDCYEIRQWHSSNVNNLENSTIHSYLNTTFLNLFESSIKDAIKQVKIPYRANGGSGGTDRSGANGLPAKIFLLSGYEVGWTASYNSGFPVDGACLSYFNGTAVTDSKRIAYWKGGVIYWWLRSPYISNTTYAWRVAQDGYYNNNIASLSSGIRPALILPPNALVDDGGNIMPPVDLTAHKALVNGTAYTVQGGKCMVNGTVYNILKGRTLINGTGYDITLPSAVTMPVKGDLITMNLDGTERRYRVLRVVGSVAEVLTMWKLSTSSAFGSDNTYSGGTLDTYLNTTWYNTLSSDAKAAIVPKNIAQDSWYLGTSGSPQYSGTYGNTAPGSTSYTISKGSDNYAAIGSRYVYAMSTQEVLDYLSDNSVLVDTSGMLRNQNIWKMFWNQTTTISEYPWLRSAYAGDSYTAWIVRGSYGYLNNYDTARSRAVRGALQIDLSKIDFTIN